MAKPRSVKPMIRVQIPLSPHTCSLTIEYNVVPSICPGATPWDDGVNGNTLVLQAGILGSNPSRSTTWARRPIGRVIGFKHRVLPVRLRPSLQSKGIRGFLTQAGQSDCLTNSWSMVRIHQEPPHTEVVQPGRTLSLGLSSCRFKSGSPYHTAHSYSGSTSVSLTEDRGSTPLCVTIWKVGQGWHVKLS